MPAITSDFLASTHQGKAIVTRGEAKFKIEMTPGETEKATYIVGFALSMVELPSVPDHIKNTPFVVRFFPNRVLALERTDSRDSMPFRINEGDDFIKAIRTAHGMCLNEQTHGKAVSPGAVVPEILSGDEPF